MHAAGTGATAGALTGGMSWSSSLKTVTLSDVELTVRAGECINFRIDGRQGSVVVAGPRSYPPAEHGGSYCTDSGDTWSFGTIGLTADARGGIEYVDFDITDYTHTLYGWTVCDRDAACTGADH